MVDPDFPGDTGNRKKDYARTDLIFNAEPITGEVWRPVDGGWRVIKRAA